MKKIKDIIKELPKEPGVYQYFDENEKLLYIGKAKNLNKRVKSYFSLTPNIRPKQNLYTRIGKMLAQAKYIDFILVNSEEDALILENSLIKQLKPRYNILLRDDKTYPYIYIDEDKDFPRFEITRRIIEGKKIKYYGPFPSGAKDLLDSIYEFFPLVQKKSCIRGKKACLFFEINKCLAPCEGKITKQEYQKIVKKAKEVLNNKKLLIKKLEDKMTQLSIQERFEEAAIIRDRIDSIKSLQIKSNIDLASKDSFDIFAIEVGKHKGVIVKIFLREGKIISSTHKFFKNIENFDYDEAYKQALLSHYKRLLNLNCDLIIVANDFKDKKEVAEAISKIINRKIKIQYPKSGKKAKLIDIALKNANELLKQNDIKDYIIEEKLKELLNLQEIPYRIEIFDNSHIMGEAPVGAMVVWDDGKWDKESFRKYELNSKDEYSQMKEMLRRRVESFNKSSPPNLWVIDGGDTLLKLAKSILDEKKVNLDVVAIAKEKIDFKAHRAKGSASDIIYTQHFKIIKLKPTDKRLQFLQKLRDKAHKVAINYHKSKKRKEDLKLSLLENKGVGKATVEKLIKYFGSFENINKANHKEIAKVTNKKVANIIKSQKKEN